MRITKVAYGFTFNLGNYQSERFDCEVQVGEGETSQLAMDCAKAFVMEQYKRAVQERVEEEEKGYLRLKVERAEKRIQSLTEKLAVRGITDNFNYDADPPHDLESLEGLHWRVAFGDSWLVSLQSQLDQVGQDNIPF